MAFVIQFEEHCLKSHRTIATICNPWGTTFEKILDFSFPIVFNATEVSTVYIWMKASFLVLITVSIDFLLLLDAYKKLTDFTRLHVDLGRMRASACLCRYLFMIFCLYISNNRLSALYFDTISTLLESRLWTLVPRRFRMGDDADLQRNRSTVSPSKYFGVCQ